MTQIVEVGEGDEADSSHQTSIWLSIKYAWVNYILFLVSVEEFTTGTETLKGNSFSLAKKKKQWGKC